MNGDLWVCDEAQELTNEQQGSFLPILAASRNPQTIYIGTPPDENAPGEVFERIRKDALSGITNKTAWSEWSVDDIGDVSDRERWADCNPSMGYRIKDTTIEAEYEQMAPDKFARERLGWWSSKSVKAVIDADAWKACATDGAPDGIVTYAVKCTPDNSSLTIAVCCKPSEGKPHVEVISSHPTSDGISSTVRWLAERAGDSAAIVIDGQGTAQAITDRLLEHRVSKKAIIRPRSSDMASACSTLLNAVNEGNVTHFSQRELDAAVSTCSRRSIGTSGGWGFSGDGSALVEAVALAHWGAVNTKRDPNRKQRFL